MARKPSASTSFSVTTSPEVSGPRASTMLYDSLSTTSLPSTSSVSDRSGCSATRILRPLA